MDLPMAGRPSAQLAENEGERQPQEALCSVLSELFKDGAACKATLQVGKAVAVFYAQAAHPLDDCGNARRRERCGWTGHGVSVAKLVPM